MTPEAIATARFKTIIGMAVSFTGMLRVFERGAVTIIEGMVGDFLRNLPAVSCRDAFEQQHSAFCRGFMASVKRSKVKDAGAEPASYGQAAKVLDVALKACVDFCGLPDADTSHRIRPFLHAGIDTPILDYLKRHTEGLRVRATTISDIDEQTYRLLQRAVQSQIQKQHNKGITPVEYDNVMWRLLNKY